MNIISMIEFLGKLFFIFGVAHEELKNAQALGWRDSSASWRLAREGRERPILTSLPRGGGAQIFRAPAAALASVSRVLGNRPTQKIPAMQIHAVTMAGAESWMTDRSLASRLQYITLMTPK